MIKKSWLKEAIEDVAREWTISSNIHLKYRERIITIRHKLFDIVHCTVIENDKDLVYILKELRKRTIRTTKGRSLLKEEYSLNLEI